MKLKNSLLLFLLLGLLSCQNTPDDPLTYLEQNVRKEIARSEGTFAVAFQDLEDSSRFLLINEKEVFHAASTMKTPVMVEVYKQSSAGAFSLNDSLLIKNEFYSIVDSSIYSMEVGEDSEEKLYSRIGEKASIYDLMVDMITYSSNLATNIIIDLVDAKKVTQTMRDIGAMDIEVLRGVEDIKAYRQGLSNTTTAYDLMLMFETIGKGRIVNPKACEEMIDILLDQHFNEGIPARLPESVKVAHKTGWITQVRHDSGLVILPDGQKYALVLLSKDWESDELATEIQANVSRIIYEYYISN